MNLTSLITQHFRLLEPQKKALKKLGIETIEDLLYHFPFRYGENFPITKIAQIKPKTKVTIYGKIRNPKTGKTFRGRIPRASATIEDETGTIHATWFGQPYIAKMFSDGDLVRAEGSISTKNSIVNPRLEKITEIPMDAGLFEKDSTATENTPENFLNPIYPESFGITSTWFYYTIQKIFKSGTLDEITETIPEEILNKYNLPNIKTALIWIHTPQKEPDAQSARKRFAFEEIFYIQIKKQIDRLETEKMKSFKIDLPQTEIKKFVNRFPFKLTPAQNNAVKAILKDMKSHWAMSRLLEGDVGSGKTAVAATAVYAVTNTNAPNSKSENLSTAYMVPTEILAKQHFENFIKFFEGTGIKIGFITGSGCYKFPSKINPTEATKISRSQLLKWVENGEIPIVVGTHALIQKSVKFKHLGLVIIDEQHRFGTKQRRELAQKQDFAPHLLSMTATPIPRTLALTIYGDLDLTLLDQMPSGRKPVITKIVLKNERDDMYKKIRAEIKNGRQAYVICPRINEPDPEKRSALYAKSVEAETKRLANEIFPDLNVGDLHGKMRPTEKESMMKKFENGEIDILVSTSVIEVGVNVPNATVILIEGAERFGLAQLHQLRGRVIRSNHQAYCFISSESASDPTIKRLRAVKEAKNGFELAEYDLELRGAGDLAGNKQWGISDLGMEAIKNIKMVEAARDSAHEIAQKIAKFPEIKKRISELDTIHFE